MGRQVRLNGDWAVSMERLAPASDGKPRFRFDIWNEEANENFAVAPELEIDDIYKIRNMINSELDDAYKPIVTDPEDAA